MSSTKSRFRWTVAATATALVLVSSAIVLGMPTTAGAVNGFPVSGESPVAVRVADGGGIFVVGSEGEVATYGDATYYGGANLATPPAPISGIATTAPNLSTTSNPKGYWLSGRDGSVYNQPSGTVQFFGSLPSLHITPSAPIVGIAGTPDAEVPLDRAALSEGRDPVLEAALKWLRSARQSVLTR